ncbi:HesB/YadR/YfhF family protein [Sporosarcina highlanderae]|uniref:HesB/YadR/YfhF family protein n=1 Tax=Sporosarcina highlanderae TaxID=3035916 RepID=A0ABT8JR13_9BACL|nr:HesB/YadR/YfhF family protein [Sporosarcina highlanderae]MDN4607596.1 HesB/YadR/YfhF family protein [Sporosarcina highlanderae]
MKIAISDDAINWFRNEMEAKSGEYIKFFARYGGSSPLHDGFSLGVTKEHPDESVVETIIEGIHFYIERRDYWFFDEHDLHVNVDSKINELVYSYKKA